MCVYNYIFLFNPKRKFEIRKKCFYFIYFTTSANFSLGAVFFQVMAFSLSSSEQDVINFRLSLFPLEIKEKDLLFKQCLQKDVKWLQNAFLSTDLHLNSLKRMIKQLTKVFKIV